MLFYSQRRGEFTGDAGTLIVDGCYSGGDHGKSPASVNNPAMQSREDSGPIPQGQYTISPAHTIPHLGPIVMALTPAPSNLMWERSGFFIHGDNAQENFSASDGCIVCGPSGREKIATLVAAGQDQLTVTI
jgi:Protein of unknown function (DUF2778)